jgi:hypothetical protein
MNTLPQGTLVTMHTTYHLGRIVQVRNAVQFEYDIQLQDGTLIEATSEFWHAVPSIITLIRDIPSYTSVETGEPVEDLPGFAYIDFYYFQGDDLDIRWKKYRERYPLDCIGLLWGFASRADGLLNEQEQAQWYIVAENKRRREQEGN